MILDNLKSFEEIFYHKTQNLEICKKIIQNLIFGEQREICRQNQAENLPRTNVKIRDFLDLEENFQEIDDEKMKIIIEETEKITFNTNFNNFNRIRGIIELFLVYDSINPENKKDSMKKAYENMNKEVNLEKGTNCSGMGTCLKKFLEKKGIYSYLVRFSAFGYINDDYVKDGHSGLVIPALISGERKFIFVDPGIRIFKPIIFDENVSNEVFCDSKKFFIEKIKEKKSEFDFCLKSVSLEGKENSLNFNSKQEWLNPNETLIPESVRSRGRYKIQKFTENENILFIMDIINNDFSLKLEEDLVKISFEEFFEIFRNNNFPEKKELFLKVFEKLGENPEKIIYDIFKIIENLEIFKEALLSPSSKEIIKNNS